VENTIFYCGNERKTNTLMKHLVQRFLSAEQGQDLTEYSLLLAFVVLAAAGIFLVDGISLNSVWISANNVVNRAAIQSHASVS
jgi:Flp pilus assembly pilin Flp